MKKSKFFKTKKQLQQRKRNNSLLDTWSLVHLTTGIVLGWIMPFWLAFAVMVVWEPLEILVLSPLLAKVGIDFGYETLRNSLSDIVVDFVGVIIGYVILSSIIAPPFALF